MDAAVKTIKTWSRPNATGGLAPDVPAFSRRIHWMRRRSGERSSSSVRLLHLHELLLHSLANHIHLSEFLDAHHDLSSPSLFPGKFAQPFPLTEA